ncbi:nucleoside 2-deoxyribosyltransferase [Candidatus Parcubacteria bacterium]|nr:nucleoside 2-deoxyribosyltransferase [Candidatus Parcubacteria bacterium]
MVIYFASALFSAREALFNKLLAEKFEAAGETILLPQRDGFEFNRLSWALEEVLSESEKSRAISIIIYLLDIGKFLPACDIVMANLDEPIDEGVVVEMVMARTLGKYVIGYRTDVRSPYGNIKDDAHGAHFFPILQCDKFLWRPPDENYGIHSITKLFGHLHTTALETMEIWQQNRGPRRHDPITGIIERAKYLFNGIDDLHSMTGLRDIAHRYNTKIDWLTGICPIII